MKRELLLKRMRELVRDFSFPTRKALKDLIELLQEPYTAIDISYFKKIFEKIIEQEKTKGKKINLKLLRKLSELYNTVKNSKERQS